MEASPMAYHWPTDTVFRDLTLEVDERTCWLCQHLRTVCCHRQRRFFTCDGPVQLLCKLCHCPSCSGRSGRHSGTIASSSCMTTTSGGSERTSSSSGGSSARG